MLLEEFDKEKDAIINPSHLISPVPGIPKTAVTCFSSTTFDRLVKDMNGIQYTATHNAGMDIPVYKCVFEGSEFALFKSPVGASACVGIYEDILQMGIERIVTFGTCGVLDKSIEDCSVIIPTAALRDEGTSFHYYPASDEIDVNLYGLKDVTELLNRLNISYITGKTWTTDGVYRETRSRMERRKAQGAICVDMECSALAALASFRNKIIFQFFYAADNLDTENWDKRSLGNHDNLDAKDRIAWLAMKIAQIIDRK